MINDVAIIKKNNGNCRWKGGGGRVKKNARVLHTRCRAISQFSQFGGCQAIAQFGHLTVQRMPGHLTVQRGPGHHSVL